MQIIKTKATPSTPASGYAALFIDSADDKCKVKKSTGTVVDLESAGSITSVNGDTGPAVALDTDDIPEGTNKYYDSALFDADLATKDTGDLAEGSNLYFTNERAQDAVGANVVAPLTYDDPSGQISIPKADASTDGYLDNADFTTFTNKGKTVAQGSIGSPYGMNTNSDITPTADFRQFWFVKSNGGALVITSNPQILSGAFVGQEIILMGVDSTDYPILNGGNGLLLNGNCALKNKTTLSLIWDGSVWVETARNDL